MQQRQRQRRRAAARPAPRALPARAARPRRAGRTPAARDGVVGRSYGGAASEGPTGPAAPAGDAVSAEDFAAMERRRRARRAQKFKTEGFYEIRADDLVLRVPPRAALDEVVLRKLPFGGREAIYVHALDIDGLAAEQGLQAGCIMRALRDPHKSEMYPIDGDERLDFIRTNWEITDEVVAVFESSPSIGAADVAAAAQAKEAAARRAAAAPQQVSTCGRRAGGTGGLTEKKTGGEGPARLVRR